MRIQAVTIGGFKNISDVKLSLDNITALVSLNNFGKSNVLTGIDFGLNFINGSINDKKEMMANINLIPLNKNMFGQNFRFELDMYTIIDNEEYQVVYGYEFCWKTDERSEPSIVSEYLKYRPTVGGQKYTQIINRDQNKSLYKSSETGRCSSKIKVGMTELVVNKLLAYDEIFSAPVIQRINSLKFYMENHLDAKSFYKPDPIIRKGLDDVAITASNLPRVIYQLKENHKEKFELLLDVYRELFPNVEDLIVKRFKINASDSDPISEEAPFPELNRYLSSGTIKGINIFIQAIKTFKTGGYLIVDELENHFNSEITHV